MMGQVNSDSGSLPPGSHATSCATSQSTSLARSSHRNSREPSLAPDDEKEA